MQRCFIIILIFLASLPANSQFETVLEQYCLLRNNGYTLMPVIHFQSRNNWYAEARYNYEEIKTFSLYAGKTFSKNTKLAYTVTPMLGGSVGNFKSISAGLNIELEYKNFFFSCQSQYSYSTGNYQHSFLYNWSELGYEALPWLYAGLSVQQTRVYETNMILEPGFLVGFSFYNFTLPLYGFSLFNENRYFIVGLNFKWKHFRAGYSTKD